MEGIQRTEIVYYRRFSEESGYSEKAGSGGPRIFDVVMGIA